MLKMLILYLLLIQLAVSYGDLMCLYQKYPKCYIPSMKSRDTEYCTGAPGTIKCMKEEAIKCHVEDSREVTDMETKLRDICQKGAQLNRVYLEHRLCIYDNASKSEGPCYTEFFNALDKLKRTGNAAQDELILFNVFCSYLDKVFQCVKSIVGIKCGTAAEDFYPKIFSHGNKFTEKACSQNTAATFDFSWTLLLLQAATVMYTCKLSENFALNRLDPVVPPVVPGLLVVREIVQSGP